MSQFTGSAVLLTIGGRLVCEVRKQHKWTIVPGKPPMIGMGRVGGSMEAGETPLQSLRREVMEEICCPVELIPASVTADMSPAGIRILPDVKVDGLQPAMIWEVTDPTYIVGSKVAVFLARPSGEPEPGDLPALILAEPELIWRIGSDTVSVQDIIDAGADIRQNIALPPDGRLELVNTLRLLAQLRAQHADVVEMFCASA